MSNAPHTFEWKGPFAIVVGGANGAGKTTFFRKVLPLLAPPC